MKKTFLTLLGVCLLTTVSFAVAQKSHTASALYRLGDFSGAVSIYENLVKQNPENPYYHYNLGNSYYKNRQSGYAIASLYRAFLLLPRDKEIRGNLTTVMKTVGEGFVPKGVPSILHKLYFHFSFGELKGLFWLCFWLWALVFSAILIFRFKSYFAKYLLYGLTFVFVFSSIWTLARYYEYKIQKAVIIVPSVSLRSGPQANFTSLALVKEGVFVLLTGQSESKWYEVKVKSRGIKGWIEKDKLETI